MFAISTRWGCLLGITIGGAYVSFANCVNAQITPDSTLPNNSSVTIQDNIRTIEGGTQAGSNLFHSFKEFSVPTGSTAFFNNGADIQNILSRVTGGSLSNIDGLIKANGTANLFLINPNGIIFGPNARLNIGGSFIGSTASSINFADGTKFSATPSPDKPLLTITAPIGLGLGTNPGEIQVRGPGHEFVYDKAQIEYSNGPDNPGTPRPRLNSSVPGLEVESGKTLALVGGKVSVEGGVLKSPAGRIEIGSVASNQAVSLVSVPEGWKLGYEGTPSFADIQFSGKSFLSTTGVGGGAIAVAGKNINFTSQSILRGDTLGDRNGGEISILGENIVINQSDISSNSFSSGNTGQIKLVANNSIRLENKAGVGTRVQESGKAGDITLQADSIFIGNKSGLSSNTDGTGNAGRMEVKANSLVIEDQSTLSNGTGNDSTGNGGEVNINVAGPLVLLNSSIDTFSFGQGDAGKINITANSLRLENESAIVSRTEEKSIGNGGEINIQVAGSLVTNESAILTDTRTGNAAKISITANSLLMENSGVKSRTINTGKAGEININVAGSFESKKLGIDSDAYGTGDGGKINIYANSLLFDDSRINSRTYDKSTSNAGEININVAGSMVLQNSTGIYTNTIGKGDAGKINIYANSFELESSQINSSTTNTGNAGEININVAGSMAVIDDTAVISTQTEGTGNAGQITVTAESLKINRGEIVATTSGSGNAGNLSVQTKTLVLDNQGRLGVESTGDGNAGTLNVVADTIQLDNQSRINATSTSGKGGDVELQIGNLLLLRRGSSISTTAGTDNKGGNGGNIRINAPNGFIVAVPNENSDITANAFSGTGGKITIKASDIFGIAPLSRQEIERLRPDDLDPSKLQTNDITAISQTNPSLSGTVEVNTPDIDPDTRLVNLPTVPVDTQVAQGCNSPNYAQSSFIITGRGGLPPNPKDILTPDAVQVDWVTLNPNIDNRKSPSVSTPTNPTPEPIVEATGWVFNAKGEVVLTGDAPTTTPRSSWNKSAECRS